MVWDDSLAQKAQKWAKHLSENIGKLEHDEESGEGENLYMSTRSSGASSCADAIKSWYVFILNALNTKLTISSFIYFTFTFTSIFG